MSVTALMLPIDQVREAPWNPRKVFEQGALDELIGSIKQHGIIEPLLVRPLPKKGALDNVHPMHEVVAGGRRFRAAQMAGLTEVPVTVRDLSELEARSLAIVENIQRADMSALEEAAGYKDLFKLEKRTTPASVAAKVGKPESHIVRRLKLLTLEAPLQKALAEGRISIGHAEALLRLSAKLREQAADVDEGVVWQRSPLLDEAEEDGWLPGADDLRPLSDLEDFIRTRSVLDHRAPDARHLQPSFGEALDEVVALETGARPGPMDEIDESVTEGLVPLSLDPMVRSRLGLKAGAPVPLPPSQWREIAGAADRCDFRKQGVIVHGGPTGRILEVCIKKSCQKHFGAGAKKKAAPRETAEEATARRAREEKQQEAQRAAEARREKIWERTIELARPAIAAAVAKVRLTPALVRVLLDSHRLHELEKDFKVKLGKSNAAQVLALSTIRGTWDRQYFLRSLKPWKFNLGPFEQRAAKEFDAAKKQAAAAAEKPDPKTAPAKGKTPRAKGAKKKGGAKK